MAAPPGTSPAAACALQNADTARELLDLVQAPMIADAGLSRA